MTTMTLRLGDQWGIAADADRRFRYLSTACISLVLAGLVALQFWEIVEKKEPPPPIRVTLLPPPPPPPPPKIERAAVEPKPLPKPVPRPESKPKPVERSTPTPAPPAPSARELASRSGLMAMRDQLSAMRGSAPASGPRELLRESAISGSRRSGEVVAASASQSSGGIGNASRSVSAVQGTGSLGARRTAEVQSTLPSGRADPGGAGEAEGGSRSLKELQLAFDRNKSSLFSIFNRIARESSDMGAGKIVVSLTIAPDGSVTRCELVSSSFENPELEQRILARVRMLNFGPKDVPPYTYANYPINFLPS